MDMATSAETFRVSSDSNPNRVAGAIAVIIRQRGSCDILTIGAGALNQAIKALAIARGFLDPSGIDLVFRPSFENLMVDGKERTAIKLKIEPNT